MTIAFDAIWIPIAITVLALAWASFMLHELGSTGMVFEELTIGLFLPAIPVLIAWLVWALLT